MAALFVKAKDIERLENLCNTSYAAKKLKEYLKKLGKKKGNSLTVYEYAEVKNVPPDHIIKAMQ